MTPGAPLVSATEIVVAGAPEPLLRFVEDTLAAVAGACGHAGLVVRRHDPTAPDADLANAVATGAVRGIAVIGDPASSLADCLARGHAPLSAARALTALAAPLVVAPGWTRVRLRPDMTRREATQALLAALDWPAGAADAVTAGPCDAATKLATCAGLQPDADGLSSEGRALAYEVVEPMLAAAATGTPQAVRWSRDCLFWGDHPDEKLPRVVGLTGPARVLAYGPYLHLPPGVWTVRATLAFSPGAAGSPFAVELHSNALLGRGRFKPASAGVFLASFRADVASAHLANEIRVINENGAIEGDIGVDHVQLQPGG
jgi:hypothetical protein